VVAKLREILALNKQAARNSDGKKFNLRKLNNLEVKNNIISRTHKVLQLWRT
jgi:hypothetical protein